MRGMTRRSEGPSALGGGQRPRVPRGRRWGLTLLELVIGAFILAVLAVAALGVFSQSGRGIQKLDERRIQRFLIQEVFSHVNRNSLHTLWDHYGPEEGGAPRPLDGKLAAVDAAGRLLDPSSAEGNPLGFTQGFFDDLVHQGLDADVRFDFYTRKQLGVDEDGEPAPDRGILHMQAGWARVTLYRRDDPSRRPVRTLTQPIMCPAIVGRPGLKLSSCPAVAPAVKCKYGPLLAMKEGFTIATDVTEACARLSQRRRQRGRS